MPSSHCSGKMCQSLPIARTFSRISSLVNVFSALWCFENRHNPMLNHALNGTGGTLKVVRCCWSPSRKHIVKYWTCEHTARRKREFIKDRGKLKQNKTRHHSPRHQPPPLPRSPSCPDPTITLPSPALAPTSPIHTSTQCEAGAGGAGRHGAWHGAGNNFDML